MQIAFYILLALIVIAAFIFGPRLAHDSTFSTYGVRNSSSITPSPT